VAALLALAGVAQGAHAGYAGLWFQCQPRWTAEKNYLVVDVQRGERTWEAHWGARDSARGKAHKDQDGNLALRGCHSLAGQPAGGCNAGQAPLFAVLPKEVAKSPVAPVDGALRRGAWIRTDKAGTAQLAQQCAALRPKANG
jgi:hypothetical protein